MTSSDKSTHQSLRLAVLHLVAGEGSRLGSLPKALLIKDQQSLLKRFCAAVQELQQIELVELVMVTGFHAHAIEEEIWNIQKDFPIAMTVSRNSTPEKGQGSSVRLGLESLQKSFDVLLVALSDQPNIGSQEITALLAEYQLKLPEQEIVLPVVQGRRGNPVLFSAAAVQKILEDSVMVCRSYMDQHPERVRVMNTPVEAYILDVDTVADIQRERLQLP